MFTHSSISRTQLCVCEDRQIHDETLNCSGGTVTCSSEYKCDLTTVLKLFMFHVTFQDIE